MKNSILGIDLLHQISLENSMMAKQTQAEMEKLIEYIDK